MSKIAIIIPSRLDALRLPNKPLELINNKEMILHVYEAAKKIIPEVYVATPDQKIIDGLHKDARRGRTASISMIPTSTGAAKAVGLVLPELEGKLDGTAIRIPTPNVSMIDFTFQSKEIINKDDINKVIKKESSDKLKNILEYNDLPLVSIDYNHNSSSSIFDSTQTQTVGDHFGRVLSWYDNEWGFSNRMCDIAEFIHQNS